MVCASVVVFNDWVGIVLKIGVTISDRYGYHLGSYHIYLRELSLSITVDGFEPTVTVIGRLVVFISVLVMPLLAVPGFAVK